MMTKSTRTLSLVAIVTSVTVLAGCGTMTGRSMGQYMNDKMLQARVKTRLATERATTLTRVNVGAYNGTVYLNGVVPNEQEKRRLEQLAAMPGHRVVSNLTVQSAPGAAAAAASAQAQPSASPATVAGERHTMTGEVTSIDHATGKVSVKTDEGTLDLHFPPSAVNDMKQGDRVAIDLGIRPVR